MQGPWPRPVLELQIKNIKLHIVTDIKVNFNSMLGFRISTFGWGDGVFYISKKSIFHEYRLLLTVGTMI